jgi:hypothetical protein
LAKGGTYEREVCRKLSAWWSGDEECDDYFWRASQSGGRATTRAKRGKTTRGHCGDVAACCSEAEILTKFITIECKRGYSKRKAPSKDASIAGLLDRIPNCGSQPYDDFIEQAIAAAKRAGTPHWLLIHKRDGRKEMAIIPGELYKKFTSSGWKIKPPKAICWVETAGIIGWTNVIIVALDNMLKGVPANQLKRFIKTSV